MGNYQLKAIEAMQVPVPLEHEAAKDLEARYAKFCAWLDEKGMTEIDFTLPRRSEDPGYADYPGFVTFTDTDQQSWVESYWLIWNPQVGRFMYMDNPMFNALYEEV